MADSILAYAKIFERIGPMDRGERYEDPLLEALGSSDFGEVSGGGTMLLESGEIEYAGIDLRLTNVIEAVPFICKFLEERGAPRGSALEILGDGDSQKFPFGTAEGLAIYFDGVNLPDEVYEQCDINVIVDEFTRLLGEEGEVRGHWQGPTETALYLYGNSADKMQSLLADYLNTYPLCRGARVVDITPR